MTRYRKNSAVSEAQLGKAHLVVNLDHGTAFRMNDTARLMWELAAQGRTAEEISAALADRLAAPTERLRADAAALLDELAAEALLEPIGEGS